MHLLIFGANESSESAGISYILCTQTQAKAVSISRRCKTICTLLKSEARYTWAAIRKWLVWHDRVGYTQKTRRAGQERCERTEVVKLALLCPSKFHRVCTMHVQWLLVADLRSVSHSKREFGRTCDRYFMPKKVYSTEFALVCLHLWPI